MNRDRVKRWTDAVRYYKLVKKQREKEDIYLEAYAITFEGYHFYPKQKDDDRILKVSKVTIISPYLLKLLEAKRDKKKQELDKTYDKKIKAKEEEVKDDNKRDINNEIIRLKEELRKLKEQEDEEYEREARRSR